MPIRNCIFAQLSKLIDDQKIPLFSNSLSAFQSSAQIAVHTFTRKTMKVHFSPSAAFCFLHFFNPLIYAKLTALKKKEMAPGESQAPASAAPFRLGPCARPCLLKLGEGRMLYSTDCICYYRSEGFSPEV